MNTRMLLAGTIPSEDISLITGQAVLNAEHISIGAASFPQNRGTAAMIAAACSVATFFNEPPPFCVIGGDIGKRTGSRLVYRWLIKNLPKGDAAVCAFHYIVPDIGLHNQVLTALRKSSARPCVIADAGFMYAAKASGQAPFYDLFIPDLGELAFLADDKATHPAYTRGFLTRLENDPRALISRAYESGNAAQNMCVKGGTDFICSRGGIVETIDTPSIEELEPIGGTGDTITGMVAGLTAHGFSVTEACTVACKANRLAGKLAAPTPATQIGKIIEKIPEALETILEKGSEDSRGRGFE